MVKPELFFHRNLGRFLCPETKPDKEGVITVLSKSYQHATKSSLLRLGSGKAAVLVQEDKAILMASIRLPHDVPPELTIKSTEWRTVPNWMAEVIVAPPEAPFMFLIFGKNPAIQDKLRVNESRDVVEICGAERLRCRPEVVRSALSAIGDIPTTAWRRAMFLTDQRDRNPQNAPAIDDQLEKIFAKHPILDDLLYELPPFGSGDYEALTLVHAVRMKNEAAARSSDEAVENAA